MPNRSAGRNPKSLANAQLSSAFRHYIHPLDSTKTLNYLFERILPLHSPFATTVWDFIHRAMPLGNEGTLSADEVYALTAYLLFLNQVILEDEALDKQSLPKVKMPHGDDYTRLPDWKPGTPRLQGYPY